jgi:phage repressor protein C with HTH and peptisase S24 domain
MASLETGGLDPATLSPKNQRGLLRALNWTPAEFYQHTGKRLILAEFEEGAFDTPAGRPAELSTVSGRLLPVRSMASAGKPFEHSEVVIDEYDRPGLQVYRVEGNSMEPTLFDGDLIYVDTQIRDLRHDEIYVVHIRGDGYVVKRLVFQGGEPWLVSDNPRHLPFQASEAEVVGLVYHARGARNLRR